jgi:hypothetical protein
MIICSEHLPQTIKLSFVQPDPGILHLQFYLLPRKTQLYPIHNEMDMFSLYSVYDELTFVVLSVSYL